MKKKEIYKGELEREKEYYKYLSETLSEEEIIELNNKGLTYIKKFQRFNDQKDKEYNYLLSDIRNYDFNKFRIYHNPYQTIIYPDKDFLSLIDELNNHLLNKININQIDISIRKDYYNLIDFENGIPLPLQGLGIAYKIYILVIHYFGWISSDINSSDSAKNLWFSLVKNNDVYCITSNFFSYLISKKLSNIILKNILDSIIQRKDTKIEIKDIIFDNDIKEKIVEIYGSMELYTQRK